MSQPKSSSTTQRRKSSSTQPTRSGPSNQNIRRQSKDDSTSASKEDLNADVTSTESNLTTSKEQRKKSSLAREQKLKKRIDSSTATTEDSKTDDDEKIELETQDQDVADRGTESLKPFSGDDVQNRFDALVDGLGNKGIDPDKLSSTHANILENYIVRSSSIQAQEIYNKLTSDNSNYGQQTLQEDLEKIDLGAAAMYILKEGVISSESGTPEFLWKKDFWSQLDQKDKKIFQSSNDASVTVWKTDSKTKYYQKVKKLIIV